MLVTAFRVGTLLKDVDREFKFDTSYVYVRGCSLLGALSSILLSYSTIMSSWHG